ATRQIGIDEVNNAINNGNVNLPAGVLYGPQRALTLMTAGQLYKAVDYADLVVTYHNGAPIKLGDLGRVIDGFQNPYNNAMYYDASTPKGIRTVQLQVFKQPGTNALEVVNGVKAKLPALMAQLPPSVKLNMLFDRSITIRSSVDDVKFTLELALML